jgi:cytochrome c oxidase subunit 2
VEKLWGAFFGLVLGAILALCVVAPFVGWWLPQNVSSFGGDVDNLFYIILAFTGVAFVLTEALLVLFMWRYAYNPRRRALFVHGNHRLEITWTVATGLILVYIAFAQVSVWERIKYQGLMPEPKQVVQVTARQWEWQLRYPESVTKSAAEGKAWADAPWIDDLYMSNELHTWKGADVRIYLKTKDVIHSFGIPNLRLMQDALPGKTIPMWFRATESNTQWNEAAGRCEEPEDPARRWEIACKELCGGGHYRMRGRLYVHPDEDDFRSWLAHYLKEQNRHEPEAGTPVAAANP